MPLPSTVSKENSEVFQVSKQFHLFPFLPLVLPQSVGNFKGSAHLHGDFLCERHWNGVTDLQLQFALVVAIEHPAVWESLETRILTHGERAQMIGRNAPEPGRRFRIADEHRILVRPVFLYAGCRVPAPNPRPSRCQPPETAGRNF